MSVLNIPMRLTACWLGVFDSDAALLFMKYIHVSYIWVLTYFSIKPYFHIRMLRLPEGVLCKWPLSPIHRHFPTGTRTTTDSHGAPSPCADITWLGHLFNSNWEAFILPRVSNNTLCLLPALRPRKQKRWRGNESMQKPHLWFLKNLFGRLFLF